MLSASGADVFVRASLCIILHFAFVFRREEADGLGNDDEKISDPSRESFI